MAVWCHPCSNTHPHSHILHFSRSPILIKPSFDPNFSSIKNIFPWKIPFSASKITRHCRKLNCSSSVNAENSWKIPIFTLKNRRTPLISCCSLTDEAESIDQDLNSPWGGAVIYKRNPSISHLEYCTTLERLGLGRLSTEISRSRASMMGLRVTKDVKDYPLGTPVQISVDVTRKKQKLKLDGIVRTVITLGCNRCAEPAAECVFSNFALLLTEEPIEEEEEMDMGLIFGEGKAKTFYQDGEGGEEEDMIDIDDRLYFPAEEKEIDISKNIRDIVHVEITINAICDTNCKGLCLKCGTNLNKSSCSCSKQDAKEKDYGPLRNLRKQVRQQ